MQRIMLSSFRLTQALAHPDLVHCILSRITHPDVTVQLNLLKMLLAIYRSRPTMSSSNLSLPPVEKVVSALSPLDASKNQSILVKELARILRSRASEEQCKKEAEQ